MIRLILFGMLAAATVFAQEPQQTIRIEKHIEGGDAGFQTFEFVGGQLLSGKPVKGMPYSAESVTQNTQTLADGSHIVNSSSSMIYRDSEGRERREESIGKLGAWSAQGQPAKAVFISDPAANVSYSLDTTAHIARRMPQMIQVVNGTNTTRTMPAFSLSTSLVTPPAAGPQVMMYARASGPATGENAPKIEHLGTSTIEGVPAEGTRTTITIPAGQVGNERDINIVSERWFSNELQVVVMSKHSDPRMGETVYKLTNINRSEPLPALFQVPSDYTIRDAQTQTIHSEPAKKDNEQ